MEKLEKSAVKFINIDSKFKTITKQLIQNADAKLTECFFKFARMKKESVKHGQFDRKDVIILLLNLHTVIEYLSSANEREFPNAVNTLYQYIERGDFASAEHLFTQVVPSLDKLDRTEKKEVHEEKPHLHIVSELECPYCHKNIPKDARFCPYCTREIKHSRCPNCRKDVEIGWKFCPHCTRQL